MCYRQCPNGTYYESNLICYEDKGTKESFLDNKVSNIFESFESGEMNDIIKNITDDNNIHSEKIDNDITLSILTTENKKYISNINISSIDFGECENELKEIYNISEPLIIVKIDYKQNNSLIPIIEY